MSPKEDITNRSKTRRYTAGNQLPSKRPGERKINASLNSTDYINSSLSHIGSQSWKDDSRRMAAKGIDEMLCLFSFPFSSLLQMQSCYLTKMVPICELLTSVLKLSTEVYRSISCNPTVEAKEHRTVPLRLYSWLPRRVPYIKKRSEPCRCRSQDAPSQSLATITNDNPLVQDICRFFLWLPWKRWSWQFSLTLESLEPRSLILGFWDIYSG